MSFAQSASAPWLKRMEARLLNMQHYKGFSGVVLIAEGDQVIFNQAYGFSNEKKEVLMQPDNPFRIASLSKAFTSASILKLVEEGKISLDDPIERFFPGIAGRKGYEITIKNLLNHTSGIPDYINDFPISFRIKRLLGWKPEKEKLVAKILRKKLEFSPGEEFNYSNSGYYLLAAVVEKISGRNFEDYLEEKILTPLGLKNTWEGNYKGERRRTVPYAGRFYKKREVKELDEHVVFGMGGMYSTALDLFKWTRGLWQGRILSDSMVKQMVFPGSYRYGLGWEIDYRFGQKVVSHGGYLPGWNSQIVHLEEADFTCIVVSNFDMVDPMFITDAATSMWHNHQVREKVPGPVSEYREDWTGRYLIADLPGGQGPFSEQLFMLVPGPEGLVIKTADGRRHDFIPSQDGIWKSRDGRLSLKFGSSGEGVNIQIREGEQSWNWKKI